MLAVLVNTLVVLAGGLLGMLLKGCLKEKHSQTIVAALGLCTVVIGITGAIATSNILIVILCLAAGTLLGELLNIESRLDGAGEWLKKRASKGSNSRFTEGFVTASLLFCVGSMAIMGSFDAGLRGDNSTIFAKIRTGRHYGHYLRRNYGLGGRLFRPVRFRLSGLAHPAGRSH